MTHTEQLVEKMVSRRVRGGHREDESRALLAELIDRFSKQNLPVALVYNGFANEASAEKFAEIL